MVKTIRIGQKDFVCCSSAYTMFKYKNETGNNLLTEISKLSDKMKDDSNNTEAIIEVVDKVLRIAYIMNCEYEKKDIDYEEWLKDIDGMLENTDWLMATLELALSPFRRGLPAQR